MSRPSRLLKGASRVLIMVWLGNRYSDYPDPIKINSMDADQNYGCSC